MYYLQSRYYDPQVGRFINADGQLNKTLLGYNQFAYCENNPVMYTDPNGKFFISLTLICVAAFATAGAIAGGVLAYNGAKSAGVADEDLWKYTVGGVVLGGIAGGVAGVFAAPAITAATGIIVVSISSAGISIVGSGSIIAAEQVMDEVYYQVTSSQAAQEIAQTKTLIPSASEQSVCVLNFQPTLEQAQQLGARACDTVIQFRTNCTTFIADNTVPFQGAFRNLRDGVVKVFEVLEVGFK